MAKRLPVPARVAKWLYAASGNQCAFPECTEVLVQPPDEDGEVVLISHIAHIVAASEDGPRGESDLTDEQRVQPKNLVLVCRKHHAIIDTLIKTHGVDFVTRIKVQHEEMIERRHAASVDITNLPRDILFLAGRDAEITDGMRYLTNCRAEHGGPTALVITGPPGIGKTSLAVHLAHEAATHFADGQVFVSGAMRPPTADGCSQLVDVILRALNVQNSATAVSPERTTSRPDPILGSVPDAHDHRNVLICR